VTAPSAEPEADRVGAGLLLAGTLVGIGLAAWSLAGSGAPDAGLPQGAIARVNDQTISAEAFARFVGAVASERRVALDAAERRRLLERMVDEELLLQRGVALGLARHEPTARRAIVAAVIATLTAEAEAEEPQEADLRTFYAEERQRFRRPGRVSLETAFVAADGRPERELYARGEEIGRRVRAGEPMIRVAAELGDPATAPLPAGPLPLESVRQYLGPTAAQAALRLSAGEVSDPIRAVGGYHVLLLRERSDGEVPAFEQIRELVRAEYLRSLGERALRDTLRELREDATLVLDERQLEAP
jgi:parvulin-like peptidyl-prolyl isomerase